LIAAGVLDGVDAIVGQHLWVHLPLGTVGLARGGMLVSADMFEVDFTGRGGHGAIPHTITRALTSRRTRSRLPLLTETDATLADPTVELDC
jgi:metal-dependent amidase/aminoacylase/carboxypeptidase family protein